MQFHYWFIIFEIITCGRSILSEASSTWQKITICTVPRTLRNNDTELELKCVHPGDRIVISWSHYGVYSVNSNKHTSDQAKCTMRTNDCFMEHTEKVAELCTGQEKCMISSHQQFVHKCSRYSNYINIVYKCIPAESTEQICSSSNIIADDVYITSPNYPADYKSSCKCVCDLKSNEESSLQIDSMSFATQDGSDIVTIENSVNQKLSFSGSLPIGTVLLFSGNTARIQFESDSDVSSSGFLISAKALQKCPEGYDGVGQFCLQKHFNSYNWFDAKNYCESQGDNILSWSDDIKEMRQLLNWFKYSDIHDVWVNSKSIDDNSQPRLISFIPKLKPGKCLVHGLTGFFVSSCHNNFTTICAHHRKGRQYPINMQCNMKPFKSRHFISLIDSNKNIKLSLNQYKRLSFIQGCLFWLLCVCIALVILNLIICLTCYRRTVLWSVNNSSDEVSHLNYMKDFSTLKENSYNNRICCTYCSQCLNKSIVPIQSHLFDTNHVYEQILAARHKPGKCKVANSICKDESKMCCHHITGPRAFVSGPLSTNASAESGYSSSNRCHI